MSEIKAYGTLYITDLAVLTPEQNDYMNKHYKVEVDPRAEEILSNTSKQKPNFSEIYGDITIDSLKASMAFDDSIGNDIRKFKENK